MGFITSHSLLYMTSASLVMSSAGPSHTHAGGQAVRAGPGPLLGAAALHQDMLRARAGEGA